MGIESTLVTGAYAAAALFAYWYFVRDPPYVKDYVEYPPIEQAGFLTFNEWQMKYGYGSQLDYEDWLKGY
tara:strand:+ start:76 stop:285 length:210 start_codon:yes stop_codon:yes gene_type:complete